MSDHYTKMVSAMFEQQRERMAPTQTIIDRLDAKKAMRWAGPTGRTARPFLSRRRPSRA